MRMETIKVVTVVQPMRVRVPPLVESGPSASGIPPTVVRVPPLVVILPTAKQLPPTPVRVPLLLERGPTATGMSPTVVQIPLFKRGLIVMPTISAHVTESNTGKTLPV